MIWKKDVFDPPLFPPIVMNKNQKKKIDVRKNPGTETEFHFFIPQENIVNLKRTSGNEKQVEKNFFGKEKKEEKKLKENIFPSIKNDKETKKSGKIFAPKLPNIWAAPTPNVVRKNPKELLPEQVPETKKNSLKRWTPRDDIHAWKSFWHAEKSQKENIPASYPVQRMPEETAVWQSEKKINGKKLFRHGLTFFIIVAAVLFPLLIAKGYGAAKNKQITITADAKKGLALCQDGITQITQGEYPTAEKTFTEAYDIFSGAEKDLNKATLGLARPLAWIPKIGDKPGSAYHGLEAGKEAALAGKTFAHSAKNIETLTGILGGKNTETSLTTGLSVIQKSLEPVVEHARIALAHAKKIRVSAVPAEYQKTFSDAQKQIPVVEGVFKQTSSLFDGLLTILGHEQKKRYLLIFGNNDELRASLGFIGGLALVDINEGEVKKLEIPGGGSYDSASWLDQKIQAPQPLRLVNAYWEMQDANWWPDWPTSAAKIRWFYEHSQGPTVDGVIGITPDVIEKLLTVTGPIDMTKEYGIQVTSENFRTYAQESAEIYRKGTKNPKQFIADFTPKFLDEVFHLKKDDFLPTLTALYDALKVKDILVYFTDEDLEKNMEEKGWAGKVTMTNGDYLMLVKSNIAGGKTDGVIKDTLTQDITIHEDGTLTKSVTLARVHQGDPTDQLQGQTNTSFLRVYVPKGSTLKNVEGASVIDKKKFFIPDEDAIVDEDYQRIEGSVVSDERTGTRLQTSFDKAVFGQWLETPAQSGRTIVFSYDTPKMVTTKKGMNTYTLHIDKQSGSRAMPMQIRITLPEGSGLIGLLPEGAEATARGVTWTGTLDKDQELRISWK